MIPIFSTLNMMQQALLVQQEAIQTTGHNISNANTEGYSRQRVNLTSWLPYPAVGINAAGGAGQIGTGVNADSIVRIRDQFVDQQVRDNSNQNSYWSAVNDAYTQMQDIINEPTDTGISSVLDGFWQSLQDLAGNSGTSGTGTVVLQNGKEVADTFNSIAQSLGQVQNNLNKQITDNTDQINSYADQINALNKEIGAQEANGLVTNDLYDQRDNLVDQLAQLVNVKVSTVKSGGNPSPLADGKYTIEIVDKDGNSFSPPAVLVDGAALTNTHLQTQITGADTSAPSVQMSLVNLDGSPAVSGTLTNMSGKLQGIIDSYSIDYPSVLKSLDNMASALANAFNTAYEASAGYDSAKGTFFLGTGSGTDAGTVTAANIHVNDNLQGSDVTSAASGAPSGDNTSATAMANVIAANSYDVDGTGSSMTLKNYLEGLIGQIGVNAQAAGQFMDNTQTMLQAAQNQQQSVSGVSLDEEMTNLIQYQQSYSAAAKVVNTLNTMLDTLINQMG
ncbi:MULTISPECIES: flagellar hook-associated protein FlgK [unclassified Sporolactobacillus]|uniref:flagellar hook-associated protein FlgK n=1 Tax=unclassified Sporolactobacillus TaxID=2628533 RepID=UPI002368D7E6|nr:flagellar hook-associated protein FlgK [Sporolactobacillus sp. CQH2019]MDD9148051.1 flagellar hook-associated protein FlgK [Sporolactobacillus sp. CQH2019]